MKTAPAWQLIDEVSRRKTGPLNTDQIRESLIDGFQRDVFDCKARNAAVIAPRSIGKTWALAAKAVAAAADGLDVAYVAKTEKSLRNYAWKTIQGVCERTGQPLKWMATDFYARIGTKGGEIRFFGGDHPRFVDNLRGTRWHLIIVDESGHFYNDLENLVMQVLLPCLLGREGGQLLLSGTPNLVPSGFFFEITRIGKERRGGWSVVECHDPYYSPYSREHVKQQLDLVAEQYGEGWESLHWVQREYFARWTVDSDALVFKYQPPRNSFIKSPNTDGDSRVLAISSRFRNRTGIVKATFNRSRYGAIFVESADAHPVGYGGVDNLIPNIAEWQRSTGGQVIVDRRHRSVANLLFQSGIKISLSREIQGKDPELQAINAANADLMTSRILIKTTGCNDLVEELTTLDWKRDEMNNVDESGKPDPNKNRECCDAMVLAWLASDPRIFKRQDKAPRYGTSEYYNTEEERHKMHKRNMARSKSFWRGRL